MEDFGALLELALPGTSPAAARLVLGMVLECDQYRGATLSNAAVA